eukprot:TRINITY_DN682_c0_g2_i4.p1 TRINITY_DN682_c0_g2~~TRINITY_DN682_c0_g2_i4.p1  ORF type:complete len:324 (+),score=119.23 TRINITY_DN682_c0_g2_i4:86-973(+)
MASVKPSARTTGATQAADNVDMMKDVIDGNTVKFALSYDRVMEGGNVGGLNAEAKRASDLAEQELKKSGNRMRLQGALSGFDFKPNSQAAKRKREAEENVSARRTDRHTELKRQRDEARARQERRDLRALEREATQQAEVVEDVTFVGSYKPPDPRRMLPKGVEPPAPPKVVDPADELYARRTGRVASGRLVPSDSRAVPVSLTTQAPPSQPTQMPAQTQPRVSLADRDVSMEDKLKLYIGDRQLTTQDILDMFSGQVGPAPGQISSADFKRHLTHIAVFDKATNRWRLRKIPRY